MNKIRLIVTVLYFTLLNISSDAFAVEHDSKIMIKSPYIRATIPGTTISSAYMSIENKNSKPVTLIGASALFSDRIEIHQHIMSDGMMKMRQVEQILIQANEEEILQPMGYHLMIFNINKPLKPEDTLSLTLHFKQQKDLVVTIPVRSIKQVKPAKKQHHHH